MTLTPVITESLKVTGLKISGLTDIIFPLTSKLIEGHVIEGNALAMAGSVGDDDRYFLKSITGLEPPEQGITIAKTRSGGSYQGKNVSDREIVMLIGLNPNEDAGETSKFLRDQLYSMINAGYDPKVRFSLLYGIFEMAYVDAYVNKFEATLSDANPMVQITFACLKPTFESPYLTRYAGNSLDEHFPNVYNRGTAETGFKFAVRFTDTMGRWFIRQADNRSIGMTFINDFEAGDVLRVSTVPGNRYVHVKKHRKKVQNKLGILQDDYEWVQLRPGMNNFVVPKRDRWDWKGNLTFTAKYWGA